MNDTTRNSKSRIPRTIGTEAARRDARNTLIAWRRSMAPEARHAADAAIAARVAALVPARGGNGNETLGVFWPVRGEPDLRGPMVRWHQAGRAISLPRVVSGDRELEFGRWEPGWTMRVAEFGIPVPEPFEPLRPTLLIVPCVGFDARGYRLGYGGGFYDRTLGRHPVPAIGVAYDGCELERFVPGAHDHPLAAIVTETRTITPGRAGGPPAPRAAGSR